MAVNIWSASHQIHGKSNWDIQLSLGTLDASLDMTSDPNWSLVFKQKFQGSVELQVRTLVIYGDSSTEFTEFCVVAERNLGKEST